MGEVKLCDVEHILFCTAILLKDCVLRSASLVLHIAVTQQEKAKWTKKTLIWKCFTVNKLWPFYSSDWDSRRWDRRLILACLEDRTGQDCNELDLRHCAHWFIHPKSGNNLSHWVSGGWAEVLQQKTQFHMRLQLFFRRRIRLHMLFLTLAYKRELHVAADGRKKNQTCILEETLDSLLWKQDTPRGSAVHSYTHSLKALLSMSKWRQSQTTSDTIM